MTVLEELHALVQKMNDNPVHIEGEKDRVYQIELKSSGKIQIIIESGKIEVVKGTPKEAAVILALSDENFSKLLKDELNTMTVFLTGGLRVEGSVGLALKLQEVVRKYQ